MDLSEAACTGKSPVIFDNLNYRDQAKAICAGCPILAACRESTIQTEKCWGVKARGGVYGGMTPAERFAEDRRLWPDLPVGKPRDLELRKVLAS